jgi:two-component system sensor histidine kinase TctE
MFFDQASAKGLDFGLDVAPASVWGHSWLLRELVSNLVDNAIKYTPPGGSVTLRCGMYHGAGQSADEPPGWAFLEVEDDGPGIAAEDRERVFEPFVRLAHGGEERGGFGLGLALVRRAVFLQGGSIGISTSALGGACFRVALPSPA